MQMLFFRKVRAQFTNVHLRSEKHGDTFVPIVDLAIRIETGAGVLAKIEFGLLEFLFPRWMDGDDADLVTKAKPTSRACCGTRS